MERYALNLKKRNFFSEKYATVPSRWRFGVKNRSFVRFSPGKGVPKTIFCPWWPRLLHNLCTYRFHPEVVSFKKFFLRLKKSLDLIIFVII